MEGESGTVDGGVSGGPSGDDHADQAGPADGVIYHGAGGYAGVFAEFLELVSEEQGSADPCDAVAEIHARCRSPSTGGFFGVAEDGHVTHSEVHGGVAEPCEEEHTPEADFHFSFLRDAGPDFREFGGFEFWKSGQSAGDEYQEHPWGGEVGDFCDEAVAAHGNCGHGRADDDDDGAPGDAGGHGVCEGRHFHVRERNADGSGGDGDHGTCEEAEQEAVRNVVEGDEFAATDFFELVVESDAKTHGYGCGEVTPCQHCGEVSQKEAEDKVSGSYAVCDKQRPDHEFRSCGVFSSIHSPEGAGAFECLVRYWFVFVFVQFVRLFGVIV